MSHSKGLDVTFISRSDGAFTLEDHNSHLAAMQGIDFSMGPSAVVETKGVKILLTSRKTPPFDLALVSLARHCPRGLVDDRSEGSGCPPARL